MDVSGENDSGAMLWFCRMGGDDGEKVDCAKYAMQTRNFLVELNCQDFRGPCCALAAPVGSNGHRSPRAYYYHHHHHRHEALTTMNDTTLRYLLTIAYFSFAYMHMVFCLSLHLPVQVGQTIIPLDQDTDRVSIFPDNCSTEEQMERKSCGHNPGCNMSYEEHEFNFYFWQLWEVDPRRAPT